MQRFYRRIDKYHKVNHIIIFSLHHFVSRLIFVFQYESKFLRTNFLHDELFRCLISMGSIMERINSLNDAVQQYLEALQLADLLKSKRKRFDALVCLGLIWIKLENLNEAKSFLKKAYYMRISSMEDDHQRVVEVLKILFAIREDLDKFSKLSSSFDQDLEERIRLADRLGDHFVELKIFNLALKYYEKELLLATEANKSDDFVSKIYVSIGQTYLDDGNLIKAIEYFRHEYNFLLGNPLEQSRTLLKIADCQELLLEKTINRDFIIEDNEKVSEDKLKNEICDNYETSLRLLNDEFENFQQNSKLKSEISNLYLTSIENYQSFLRQNFSNDYSKEKKIEELSKLSRMTIQDEDQAEEKHQKEGDDQIEAKNDVYDQYDLDLLLSDESDIDSNSNECSNNLNNAVDQDEEMPRNFYSRPKRNPRSQANRLNQFGETALHTACISGDLAQVKRLINQSNWTDMINARDFCGWTPLHEASNHGHLEIIELLLENGADIEANDERSENITPLHDACSCGHLKIIEFLLERGANVCALNANAETPVECLISWRERCCRSCKNEERLSEEEIKDCSDLETKMINLMKRKGYDLGNLFKRKSQPKKFALKKDRETSHDYNSYDNDGNDDGYKNPKNTFKNRNLVRHHIYSSERKCQQTKSSDDENGGDISVTSRYQCDLDEESIIARNQYKNAMNSLRHFGTKSSVSNNDFNDNHKTKALVDEDEIAPRDDWLIDDVSKHKVKSRKRNNDQDYFPANTESSTVSFKRHRSVGNSIDNRENDDGIEEIDFVIEKDKDSHEGEIILDQYQRLIKSTSIDNNESSTSKLKKSSSNNTSLMTETSNFQTTSAKSANHSTTVHKNRKALTVQFDDLNRSSFIVFITSNDCDCCWLKEELIRRYFLHYGMKPLFQLKTENDAILLDCDLVSDILDNEQIIKAVVNGWTIDQPEKRYQELCQAKKSSIDSNIESLLRRSYKSFDLNLSGIFFPDLNQITLMFKALLKQNLKKLVSELIEFFDFI